MQEMYDSDYKIGTTPGSAYWDAFKYGDELWQRIYKEKLRPFEEYYAIQTRNTSSIVNLLLLDIKNSMYSNYYEIA